ncbi:UDP-N-acetylmuramate dehydrogenase [Marinobacter nauticus]
MKPACSPCEQVDLVDLNSLRVHASARYLINVHSVDELNRALVWADEHNVPLQVLGGGSNLVFVGHFPGLVLHMAMKGRQLEPLDDDQAMLVLKAGENWHEAVLFAARAGYRGIENLALIPGTAGAAPVQNIGAYGVELCDTLESLTALDRSSGELVTLTASDCCFGYRDSRFKHEPGRYIIIEIRLRLSRSAPFRLGYGDLQARLPSDDADLTPLAVAQAVMAVRQEKLPDPSVLPNAGSFFKNPVVSQADYQQLQARFPGLVSYPVEQGVKLAAGWLIDQAGWKGFRNERVGVHDRQALVLINHSGGSGRDILALAEKVRASVLEKFGVTLEMEPGIVGTET